MNESDRAKSLVPSYISSAFFRALTSSARTSLQFAPSFSAFSAGSKMRSTSGRMDSRIVSHSVFQVLLWSTRRNVCAARERRCCSLQNSTNSTQAPLCGSRTGNFSPSGTAAIALGVLVIRTTTYLCFGRLDVIVITTISDFLHACSASSLDRRFPVLSVGCYPLNTDSISVHNQGAHT
jgi:hypothetical protein